MPGDANEAEKERSIREFQLFYKALIASREIEHEALEDFAKVCETTHRYLSDREMHKLTVEIDQKGLSRTRIQQLRHGEVRKKR